MEAYHSLVFRSIAEKAGLQGFFIVLICTFCNKTTATPRKKEKLAGSGGGAHLKNVQKKKDGTMSLRLDIYISYLLSC
jgi:hypothetical protein